MIEQFTKSLQDQHDIKIDTLEEKIAELEAKKCEIIQPIANDSDTGIPEEGVKILIEMENNGDYTIKEWSNAASNMKFDNMIFEIFKNNKGHLELVHWTEDELMEMFGEMKAYWDNEEFWDQVMIGYTNLSRDEAWDHYQKLTIHKDACNVLSYHLND